MGRRAAAVAPKRRESEPPDWLASNDAVFAENARRLASAKGRASRDQLLRDGLAGEFAARLLRQAQGDTQRQVEGWKLVGALWADEAWREHLRAADVAGAPPSPLRFSGSPLTSIAQALLGLYGEDALAWCAYAYLVRTGPAATPIEQAILARALDVHAVIEAIGTALTELEADPTSYPSGIPGKVATLLLQCFAGTATPGQSKGAAAKIGSLTFNRDQAATLIQALLSARLPTQLPADAPAGNNLENALAETAWVEADEALARALQQTPALREAIREPTGLNPQLRSQIGAIIQAVRTSAAKRELDIEGTPGSEATFDPVKHAHDDPRLKAVKRVRIVTPTVFQGRGTNRRVLRAADVEPA